MNLSALTVRHWISIGLCVLGLAVPIFVLLYGQLRYPSMMNTLNFNRWTWVESVSYQWLPFTAMLWLLASYVSPFANVQRVGWTVFILGILLSFAAYFFLLVASQQSIFYTTRHWISLGLHFLSFAVPFIVTMYLRSRDCLKLS
jgi:hypothetical protein